MWCGRLQAGGRRNCQRRDHERREGRIDEDYPLPRSKRARSRSQERLLVGLAFVMELLAARDGDLELGAPLLVEIELQRHDRHALAIDRAGELVDLPLVQQQPARPLRGVVEAAALQVFRDVGVDQPELAAAGVGVGLRDRRLAAAQRLDLGAGQRDAGLEGLADLVVETRPAVVGDDLELAIRFRRHIRLHGLSANLTCFAPSGRRGFRSAARPLPTASAERRPPSSAAGSSRG